MCMSCGCNEVDKRHQPTDITREDLQRAADGAGVTLRQAAMSVRAASETVVSQGAPKRSSGTAPWSSGKRF